MLLLMAKKEQSWEGGGGGSDAGRAALSRGGAGGRRGRVDTARTSFRSALALHTRGQGSAPARAGTLLPVGSAPAFHTALLSSHQPAPPPLSSSVSCSQKPASPNLRPLPKGLKGFHFYKPAFVGRSHGQPSAPLPGLLPISLPRRHQGRPALPGRPSGCSLTSSQTSSGSELPVPEQTQGGPHVAPQGQHPEPGLQRVQGHSHWGQSEHAAAVSIARPPANAARCARPRAGLSPEMLGKGRSADRTARSPQEAGCNALVGTPDWRWTLGSVISSFWV